jgi:hypothetical protein
MAKSSNPGLLGVDTSGTRGERTWVRTQSKLRAAQTQAWISLVAPCEPPPNREALDYS